MLPHSTIGVLTSGGLDSSILAAHLAEGGHRVQPFYIRFDLVWQEAELAALRRFLAALDHPRFAPLVVLDMPLADLYGDHWSITGRDVPSSETPDEAVYLPGRNVLLIVKAALWCQANGIGQLALASLGSNPFADATSDFFTQFESVLNRGPVGEISLVRPFGDFSKCQVMQLGREYPLALTFSCIDPHGGLHCGVCNKCAERQDAFRLIGKTDGAVYAPLPIKRRPCG
jgi:7-cyano-7-deazaguanine synthase